MSSPDIFAFNKSSSFSEDSKTEHSSGNSSAATTPVMNSSADGMFGGDTFSSGNGEEIAVEPLESISDGKDEDCKKCQ